MQISMQKQKPSCLSLIAAVARDGGIGYQNQLLVHLPADLQHFKTNTWGCPVIMGHHTWQSLPPRFRPLPERRNIVLSRQISLPLSGAETATSLEQALAMVSDAPRAFVIGGAQIYAQALPWADELILTEIDRTFPADAWFPTWDRARFQEVARTEHSTHGPDTLRYAFVTYQRIPHEHD
jgi:dihydrofolate reductase